MKYFIMKMDKGGCSSDFYSVILISMINILNTNIANIDSVSSTKIHLKKT